MATTPSKRARSESTGALWQPVDNGQLASGFDHDGEGGESSMDTVASLRSKLAQERQLRAMAEEREADYKTAAEEAWAVYKGTAERSKEDGQRVDRLLQREGRQRQANEQRVKELEAELKKARTKWEEGSQRRGEAPAGPAEREGMEDELERIKDERDEERQKSDSLRVKAQEAEMQMQKEAATRRSEEERAERAEEEISRLQSEVNRLNEMLQAQQSQPERQAASREANDRAAEAITEARKRREEAENRAKELEEAAAQGRQLQGEKEQREQLEEEVKGLRGAKQELEHLSKDAASARSALEAVASDEHQNNDKSLPELARAVAEDAAGSRARALAAEADAAEARKEKEKARSALLAERQHRAKSEAMGGQAALQEQHCTEDQEGKADTNDDNRRVRVEELEAEKKRLENEVWRLGRMARQAEKRLGRGEYDPRATKVLRMKHNPSQKSLKAQAEKEATQKEEQSPSSDASVKEAENAILRRRLSEVEKRERRYKEVFREQVATFKDAVAHILGWRVWLSGAPGAGGPATFKLRSMYADSPSQVLEFRYHPTEAEGRRAELVPNDFSSTDEVSQQVDIFINRYRCPPGLCANLIVEEFNKRTLA